MTTYAKPTPRDYQIEAADSFLELPGGSGIIQLATGCGKCLGRGTPVLMFDGTIRAVEDVAVGDKLMGPDSLPRTVTSLARGREPLYRVVPVKGEPFVVNESHILSLKHTESGHVTNIAVTDYLQQTKWFKHVMKGWRTGVEFPARPVPLDPYYLGLWLADGDRNLPIVYKPDPEVEATCRAVASNHGMGVRQTELREGKCPGWAITFGRVGVHQNPVLDKLRSVNVIGNKHIPNVYKVNSSEVRLAVLAGLLDGDGSLTHDGCSYDYISVSEVLARDLAFLARSLGLAAYVKSCVKGCQNGFTGTYWRVSISGQTSIIPCRIPRKKANVRQQKKDVLRFGFSLEPLGEGDYFGFSIDGPDRLFLLGDFTVTHNTLTTAHIFDRFDGRSLFLAHTDELVRQTCRAMLRMGLWPKVEKADEYRGGNYVPDLRERKMLFHGPFPPNNWFTFDKVLVSSMQTFITRMDKYEDCAFDLTVVDECHRIRCKTYEQIIERLREFNPAMRLLGLSATPYRADKKNLGKLLPAFAYKMPILDAIDRGWLVDVRGVQVEMKADTSKWVVGSTKHGRDLTDSSLRASMASDECIESIAHPIIEKGEGRKAIVFLPGVESAEAVAAAINALKPGTATFVHGGVPKKERRRRVRAFEDGEFTVMTGVQVMVEGFDVPDVSLVVMARPTQSRGLYEQCLGRGLRPIASCIEGKGTPTERRAAIQGSAKSNVLVMDFVNNTRFKLVNTVDVLLSGGADKKKREYVDKFINDRSDDDRRAIRDQLEEIESLFTLSESLRTKGGPPPRQEYTTKDVNLYGAGGTASVGSVANSARPSSDMLALAAQLLIDPTEAGRMNAQQLTARIEYQKNRVMGKKNFGMLINSGVSREQMKNLGINWHDAQYLRKLLFARPKRDLPANWPELLANFRKLNRKGGA